MEKIGRTKIVDLLHLKPRLLVSKKKKLNGKDW